MPNSPPPPRRPGGPLGPDRLEHKGYSATVRPAIEQYQGREVITSRTESIQGKVFYPRVSRDHMEAIVVDYEKDKILREYIGKVEQQLTNLIQQMRRAQRKVDFAVAASVITAYVAADFPYSKRMKDDVGYRSAKYPPGGKVHLGVFMQNQDMICRHHGLLAVAVLDFFRTHRTYLQNVRELRFVADQQQDLLEEENSGHAYGFAKHLDPDKQENKYYILDPSRSAAVEMRNVFSSGKREKSPVAYRYLFSTLRVLFQKEDPKDRPFIEGIFERAKTDAKTRDVLRNIEQTLTNEPTSLRRFYGFKARAAITW